MHSINGYLLLCIYGHVFAVLGCPTYKPPEGATTEQNENEISVSCPDTGSSWKMVCDGQKWSVIGKASNCTSSGTS